MKDTTDEDILFNTIHKSIIASLNTDGGVSNFELGKCQEMLDSNDTQHSMNIIIAKIISSIYPEVKSLVKCAILEKKQKKILQITVKKGTNKPYFLVSKGMSPAGVFIKYGKHISPASEAQIQQMIDSKTPENYEEIPSSSQSLSFEDSMSKKLNFTSDKERMKSLGLVDNKNYYTNLALLLSDKCEHTIKIAVFEGINKTIPKKKYEAKGPILQQIEDCLSFIDRYNSRSATTKGLRRIDTRDYPKLALREALINLILHRDYKNLDSSLICIYADRIEFINNNGLHAGVSKNDILLGASFLRNKNLGNIFYHLDITQLAGTGISNIFESYRESASPPLIEVSENVFKVTIFNRQHDAHSREEAIKTLTKKEKSILEFLQTKDYATRAEIQTALSIPQPSAITYIRHLKDKNLIIVKGQGRSIRYKTR